MNAYPSSLGQLPAPQPSRKGYWQRFGGKFLALSILAHVLFLLGAAYLVVHTFAPPIPAFQEIHPAMNPDTKAAEDKTKMAKLTSTMPAPPAPKIITSTGPAQVTMPDIQSPVADVMPVTLMTNGQGLHGYQPGPTGQISNGPHSGNGPSMSSPVGGSDVIPGGLKGAFYDLKLTTGRKDSGMTYGKYADTVNQFVKGNWNESLLSKYLKGTRPLYATQIFFPEIDSNVAPQAFASPATDSPGMWVVVYKGVVSPPESGTYHFVGAGDDDMIVRFDGKLVLHKCEHIDPLVQALATYHYAGLRNEFGEGLPMTVEAGKFYNVEILIGDHIPTKTMAMLLIEKEGVTYNKDVFGAPILPPFAIAADKPVPEIPANTAPLHVENGPAWQGKASSSSMLDDLDNH